VRKLNCGLACGRVVLHLPVPSAWQQQFGDGRLYWPVGPLRCFEMRMNWAPLLLAASEAMWVLSAKRCQDGNDGHLKKQNYLS
jgi:hypothetical protein